MKKILSLTLLALACAWTTSAVAADGVYVVSVKTAASVFPCRYLS